MQSNKGHFRTTASIIAVGMFMEQLDATVLGTAIPSMAPSFGVPPADLSIALTAYLLSLAVLIPASGFVADRIGPRTIYLGALVTFLLGSILCANASTMPFLVAARLVQGAGGAMMVPVGRLLLLRTIEKKEFIPAMGWLLTIGLAGQILGPTIGGLIATYLNWRWIFYLNLPIGLVALFLTYRFIADIPTRITAPFDWFGFCLVGAGLTGMLFGVEGLVRINDFHSSAKFLWLLICGTSLCFGYIVHSRRLKDRAPILDLSLLHIRTFRLAIVAGSLTRITQGALPFLLPLMMQSSLGLNAAQSGLVTFSMACGFVAMKPVSPIVLRNIPIRKALIYNSILSSCLCAACAGFRSGWPHWLILLTLFLAGFSLSLQITAYNIVCFEDIPTARTGAANSFFSTFQQLMLSMGVCVATASLQASSAIVGYHALSPEAFSLAILVVTGISLWATYFNVLLPDKMAQQNPH